jgi:hypothetical protein
MKSVVAERGIKHMRPLAYDLVYLSAPNFLLVISSLIPLNLSASIENNFSVGNICSLERDHHFQKS